MPQTIHHRKSTRNSHEMHMRRTDKKGREGKNRRTVRHNTKATQKATLPVHTTTGRTHKHTTQQGHNNKIRADKIRQPHKQVRKRDKRPLGSTNRKNSTTRQKTGTNNRSIQKKQSGNNTWKSRSIWGSKNKIRSSDINFLINNVNSLIHGLLDTFT